MKAPPVQLREFPSEQWGYDLANVDLPVALSVSCANVDGSSQINLKGVWT